MEQTGTPQPQPTSLHRPVGAPLSLLKLVGTLMVVGLLAVYAWQLLVPVYSNAEGSDFNFAYYPAARLLVDGGAPYSIISFVQPPALLLVFAPLTVFPPETARAVWLIAQALMLVVGVFATIRLFDF